MGQRLDAMAAGYGLDVCARLDEPFDAADLSGADVAVDFSHGESVARSVSVCLGAGVPIVVGTTGWDDRRSDVLRSVEEQGGALIHAANFSVGVALFFRVIAQAAEQFAQAGYSAFMEEHHHAAKRDAPSGTALHVKRIVDEAYGDDLPVAVVRAGHIPGTHRVGFDSAADQILLSHEARTRDGFADGALRAARWIVGKRGVFAFADVLDDVLAPSP